MRILRHLLRVFLCVFCMLIVCNTSYGAGNIPYGDIGEYGSWITEDNMQKFNSELSTDMTEFQKNYQTQLKDNTFVPPEVKISLSFMKALSLIDDILQISLVRFTIIFLFIMYAFWIAIEAYKLMRDSGDYKTVLYDIFKKGFIIAVWVIVLNYGPAKIFTILISPILSLGIWLSDFILKSVSQMYDMTIPDTCGVIHQYVNANDTSTLLSDSNTAANIICLPARISVFFYHATGTAFHWMINGFGNSTSQFVIGAICIVIFIKCIFKYAFMTLGVVADLFLTLLMLPFTAIAEAMPTTSEKNYIGQIFNGFLGIFNTKKLSDIISVFINTSIYFVSLAIIVAICSALLTNIISLDSAPYSTTSAMITILCGCLVLYLAGRAEEFTKQIGGSIDNSFGQKLQEETKLFYTKIKNFVDKMKDKK